MADKVVALFVEGPTEIEFYKAVVIKARELMDAPYECKIEYVDMKGIGNFKTNAIRQFNYLKRKHSNKDIYVFLCIDQDAFEFSRKPPFNRTKLSQRLKTDGAKRVTYIVAKQSIEDWFLCDLEGVLNYLHLPATTKRPKGNGQDTLKLLFKKANKIYVKGSKTEGFIDKLHIMKILKMYCSSIKPLCQTLSLNCEAICENNNRVSAKSPK